MDQPDLVLRVRRLEHVPVKWSRDTYGLRELHTRFPSPLVDELAALVDGYVSRLQTAAG